MDIYTNSMLKDWKTCSNKYYFKYIKKILIPQNEEFFELGKKVHALISYYLNNFDMSIMEKTASSEVLEHYHSILKHPILKQQHFLSEWGFNVKVKDTNNLFTGRIDAVFFDKEKNKYTIADWKTGMKIPSNPILEPQTQIYLYAFYKASKDLGLDIKPEQISFSFIQTPTLNESAIDFSQELCERFENEFLNTFSQINNYEYKSEFTDSKKCEFCEYKFMCQKASA